LKKLNVIIPALIFLLPVTSRAQQSLDSLIESNINSLVTTYKTLHAAPELSHREEKTSSLVAREFRSLGYTVTEHLGKYEKSEWTGYGVVALMKNGAGPTVLVRTDMDALPVEENTQLDYASKVKTKNDAGQDVSVMHACGHDIHITTMLGTARMLAALKDQWSGTLILLGQPAEETIDGARAMLRDGLYSRFPKPDFVIALHDSADLEAGVVGYTPGYALSKFNEHRHKDSWYWWARLPSGKCKRSDCARSPASAGATNDRQSREFAARSGSCDCRLDSWWYEVQHYS